MGEWVQLVGLDFGTTTSSAVVAEARLTRNAVTGRTDLDQLHERFRSEPIFTPMRGEQIDESALAHHVDAWLRAGNVRPGDLFGGGALLTGLTAQRDNAQALIALVRDRLGDALVATADDPCLESWLAFMGSVVELSRDFPNGSIINLDVGGGTTNIAQGQSGEVQRTGCLFVGARHVQVEPGTYRLTSLSRYSQKLFEHLHIDCRVGSTMTVGEVDAVVSFYVDLLEAAVCGNSTRMNTPIARLHEQVPFQGIRCQADEILTLSGGVGELVYAHLDGKPWPSTTAFGDLGIDLAQKLVQSHWANDFRRYRPKSAGRATVYGLLRHSTEISGNTLYLPHPELLPLLDLPIVGTVSSVLSDDDLADLVQLAQRCERGACLRVEVNSLDAPNVQRVGMQIRNAVASFPTQQPLVLLVRENLGKVLGQIVSCWGKARIRLMVIDEVPTRNAHYARIGRPRQQVVPVSFYGMG